MKILSLKAFLYIISVMAIIFLVLFINENSSYKQLKNEYKYLTENYKKDKIKLVSENNLLRSKIENKKVNNTERNLYLYEHDIRDMKRKGLVNPVQEIISDLIKHPEFIPYEGVLGGTMRFYDGNILTNKWVLAYFEDGHISGYMLLEYDISKNGKISWTVLSSMLT